MKRAMVLGGILVFAVILSACASYHQEQLPNPSTYQAHFPDMDANGDERVDFAEFKQFFPDADAHVFEALDMNKDSAVDHDEWHAFKKAHGLKKH